nr:hypothetical protein [Planctomycetota bacterium]
ADRNQDGTLDRMKLLNFHADVDGAVVGTWFLRYDQNGDRRVSAAEWNREGWESEPVYDPVVAQVQEGAASFRTLLAEFDQNGDGALDVRRWPGDRIKTTFPNLGDVPPSAWDRDGDGEITEEEAHSLLEVAWGVRRPSGELYRPPTGHVLNWDHIRKLDKNRDGRLSRAEFLEGRGDGRERDIEIFEQIDADGDEIATFAELAAAHHLVYDALLVFSLYDSNGDGLIDQTELDANPREWEKKLTPFLVAAFDEDGDGRMDLREFRLTPLVNPYADWYSPRPDVNYDGRLSWEEFYAERSPELIALYQEFFRRFDLDENGFLTPNEFEFRIDLDKLSDEVAFAVQDRDGNGRITFEEIFSDPRPEGQDAEQAEAYQLRLIRAEESFLTGDVDGDGALNLAEYREARRSPTAAAMLGPTAAMSPESDEGMSWPIMGFLAIDALVLLGLGFWFLCGSRSKP